MPTDLRQRAKAPPAQPGRNWDEFAAAQKLTGPWEVRFQPHRGAPEKITFEALLDWSQHPDPGVKYFSGTATYRTTFVTNPRFKIRNQKSYLNLGRVEVMARVRLNGQNVGVVWKPPFRLDVSDALKPGENLLEITVANLWPNRLIGDAGLAEPQRIAWTTWNPFTKDTALLESGLLGPVTLEVLRP